jgi:hypothetical protein
LKFIEIINGFFGKQRMSVNGWMSLVLHSFSSNGKRDVLSAGGGRRIYVVDELELYNCNQTAIKQAARVI